MPIQIQRTSFEAHYPVIVMDRDLNGIDRLNADLATTILDLETRFRDTAENAARDLTIATEGGYQTSGRSNLLNHSNECIGTFKQSILLPAIKEYLREVFGASGAALRYQPFAWANILRAGDWQRPHCHASAGNMASGVYYVNVPPETPPAGNIDFLNPVPISVHHGYSPCRRIQPTAGKLLLFPPYHLHCVHPVTCREPRIVIAFDVLCR